MIHTGIKTKYQKLTIVNVCISQSCVSTNLTQLRLYLRLKFFVQTIIAAAGRIRIAPVISLIPRLVNFCNRHINGLILYFLLYKNYAHNLFVLYKDSYSRKSCNYPKSYSSGLTYGMGLHRFRLIYDIRLHTHRRHISKMLKEGRELLGRFSSVFPFSVNNISIGAVV